MCKGIFSLISLLSQQHEAGWRERRKNCRKGNSQRVPSLPGIWHARTKKYLQEFANKTAHVLCIDPHKQTEKASNDTLSCSFLSMHFTLSFKFHQNPKLCIKKKFFNLMRVSAERHAAPQGKRLVKLSVLEDSHG